MVLGQGERESGKRKEDTYGTMAKKARGSRERATGAVDLGGSGHSLRVDGGGGVEVESIGDEECGGACGSDRDGRAGVV